MDHITIISVNRGCKYEKLYINLSRYSLLSLQITNIYGQTLLNLFRLWFWAEPYNNHGVHLFSFWVLELGPQALCVVEYKNCYLMLVVRTIVSDSLYQPTNMVVISWYYYMRSLSISRNRAIAVYIMRIVNSVAIFEKAARYCGKAYTLKFK